MIVYKIKVYDDWKRLSNKSTINPFRKKYLCFTNAERSLELHLITTKSDAIYSLFLQKLTKVNFF